jgi:hypothetical protein
VQLFYYRPFAINNLFTNNFRNIEIKFETRKKYKFRTLLFSVYYTFELILPENEIELKSNGTKVKY